MVDGFVQQYRDGGWVARWSSPGYADLMTGTSSDVAFADAYVKGVKGFDAADAYDAALKNATVRLRVEPIDTDVGRKGLIRRSSSATRRTRCPRGSRGALEGYINDYGIGNMAAALAKDPRDAGPTGSATARSPPTSSSRAQDYVQPVRPARRVLPGQVGRGRLDHAAGPVRPARVGQGGDYTETDGWNFAFHAPQDGRGLANLYGGRAQLAAKLDQFFATPETATKFPGRYGGTIHEMLEARDVRMGQCGASNQISHHIAYMYDFTGQPSKGQADQVREALRRLYVGSEIGQGYPGDEDNGEMSAWYVFSSLGIYPLQVGRPSYAIGSPLFTRAVIHRQGGGDIVVNAPAEQPGATCTSAACGSTGAIGARRTSRRTTSPAALASTSAWARSPRRGARRPARRRRR